MIVTFTGLVFAYPSNIDTAKLVRKRESSFYANDFPAITATLMGTKIYTGHSLEPWISGVKPYAPSPSAVANAIAAAKQASANVLIAQQQVQAAKEHVLNQQKIAMNKETEATIQAQKSEAVAAVQRSEAAAAAQAVVLAQQRLAAAKASVAHQQRIAATKEAEAAAALQSSAHAAAAEIQRTENEATKLANLQRDGAAAAAHHVSATKDAALAPLAIGNNHVPPLNYAWPTHLGSIASSPWASVVTPYYTPSKATLSLNPIWG